MYKCADGHFVPSYLLKVGTLNLGGNTRSGTKLILLASTRPYASDPSTILRRSSMSSSFRWASLLSDCSDDFFLIFSYSFRSLRSGTAIGSTMFTPEFCPTSFVRSQWGRRVAVRESSSLLHWWHLCHVDIRSIRGSKPCWVYRLFPSWVGLGCLVLWVRA